MAGYWSIFFLLLMDQDGVEAHKLPIRERGQYPAILTEKARPIKDLLYLAFSDMLFAGNPEEVR